MCHPSTNLSLCSIKRIAAANVGVDRGLSAVFLVVFLGQGGGDVQEHEEGDELTARGGVKRKDTRIHKSSHFGSIRSEVAS
ncbi:hypothetical protein X798_04777 [Onchocerca flexuosa]|uniref:Uncharacterized protein n=1 Tax=Onchocerca flexuosa TaxID=387005 RepID=A0A238BUJ4_9BILA|nr:hypothetical protein X798_04777 [Onchocerca flexuosa]